MKKNYEYYKGDLITRIGYIWFSSYRHFVHNEPSLTKCFISFFINCLCAFRQYHIIAPKVSPVIFVSFTINNNRALSSIWKKLDKNSYCVWQHEDVLPAIAVKFYSLLSIFKFCKSYFGLDSEDRKVVRFFFDRFINIYGYYFYLNKFLFKNSKKIKLVAMANDHLPINRLMVELCREYSIKTLYLQHASVTERFPPLSFSFSFLDGLDSYRKYLSAGNNYGDVFLSGAARFDSLPVKIKTKDIGIAIGNENETAGLYDLCKYLTGHQCNGLIVRPHPQTKIDSYYANKFSELGVIISDSDSESSFEFLSKVSVLIASESSIHLDSAIMEVPSTLYIMDNNGVLDWYSYVKNSLIAISQTKEDVLKFINSNPKVNKTILKDYNAAIFSKNKHNISAIIAGFIKLVICNKDTSVYINSFFCKDGLLYKIK